MIVEWLIFVLSVYVLSKLHVVVKNNWLIFEASFLILNYQDMILLSFFFVLYFESHSQLVNLSNVSKYKQNNLSKCN